MEIPRKLALYVFNLKEDYTTQELKEAYKKLAMISHPDTGGTNNLFAFINACNDVLQQDNKNSNSNQNNTKSSSSNTQKTTNSYEFITLSELYEFYYIISCSCDSKIFKDIISHATFHISPIFRKKLSKEFNITLSMEYSDFFKCAKKYVLFSTKLNLPAEFSKYNFFKVVLFIEKKKYTFWLNAKNSKVISSRNAFQLDESLPDYFSTKLCIRIFHSTKK